MATEKRDVATAEIHVAVNHEGETSIRVEGALIQAIQQQAKDLADEFTKLHPGLPHPNYFEFVRESFAQRTGIRLPDDADVRFERLYEERAA